MIVYSIMTEWMLKRKEKKTTKITKKIRITKKIYIEAKEVRQNNY
jgi:ribonuclease HI